MRAGLRDQRQFDRQFQIGLQLHRLAVQRLRRQAAQPGEALPLAGERGHRAARRRRALAAEGFSTTVPAEPSTTAMSPGWIACARPAAPSTAGTPSARSITAVWPVRAAFLGRHAGEARRIEQCGVRRPQRLADQHRAFRQAGEAAERRAGQVAHQPPARSRAPPRRGAPGRRGPPPACRARPAPGSPSAIASASSTTALSAESSVSSIRRRAPRIRRDGPSIRI